MPSVFLSRHRKSTIAIVCLAVLSSAVPGHAKRAWLKVETPGFTIYSDASEKSVAECAVHYAAFRHALQELFVPPGRSLAPSVLILCRLQSSFRDITPDSSEPRGFMRVNYQAEIDGTPYTAFAIDIDRRHALAAAYEFETVWALRRLGYFVPIWMSQGAGEVLSELQLHDGECLIRSLDEHSFRTESSWPRFFEINQSSKEYHDARRLADYLGQAWGLMHWILLRDNATRERFADLAGRLRHSAAIDAVAAEMATSPGRFNASISRHLAHSRTPRELPFDEAAARAQLHFQPVPEAEILAQLSNLLAAGGEYRLSDAQLDRARALDPHLPAVEEAWARRMLREGRHNDAVEAYRAAIAAHTENSAAYLISATTHLDDAATGGRDVAGQGGFMANLAIDELRQAIKLNPAGLEAYRQLGRAFYVSPAVTDENAGELAGGIVPGEAGSVVRFYRALIYGRLKHTAECRADLQALVADPTANNQIRQLAALQLKAIPEASAK